MAKPQNASSWALAQLISAAGKFTFDDGKVDIAETQALIGVQFKF